MMNELKLDRTGLGVSIQEAIHQNHPWQSRKRTEPHHVPLARSGLALVPPVTVAMACILPPVLYLFSFIASPFLSFFSFFPSPPDYLL